jgi:hypothetical protein
MRPAHFRVEGRFDGTRSATVTVDRLRGLISVRPARRRRVYELPLAAVAAGIIYDVTKAELAAKRAAKRKNSRVAGP